MDLCLKPSAINLDMIKVTCWYSSQTSEWGRKKCVLSDMNIGWMFVPKVWTADLGSGDGGSFTTIYIYTTVTQTTTGYNQSMQMNISKSTKPWSKCAEAVEDHSWPLPRAKNKKMRVHLILTHHNLTIEDWDTTSDDSQFLIQHSGFRIQHKEHEIIDLLFLVSIV